MSAFFVSVVVLPTKASALGCGPVLANKLVEVSYVYDGDTVKIAQRQKVRLAGINTPELDSTNLVISEVAAQATVFTRHWIDQNAPVYLQVAQDAKDNYGRTLGYLVSGSGEDLGEALIKKGLAYAVTVAPNDEKQQCYARAETLARKARVGVWSSKSVVSRALNINSAGFQLITGKITRVFHFKTADAVVIDDSIVLMIKPKPSMPLRIGRSLEVRGWVNKKRFRYDDFTALYVLHLNNIANIKVL